MSTRTLLTASLTTVLIIVIGAIVFVVQNPAITEVVPLCRDFSEGEITVGTTRLAVAVASTSEAKRQGLSRCKQLPEAAGMIFPYNPPQATAFWMKDMEMPIDIVWIRGGRVVKIDHNVPAPVPGTPTSQLTQYQSPGPVDAVLEIKSGGAADYGIEVGSSVVSQ